MYAENNYCAEVVLNNMFIEGVSFSFKWGVMKKLGSHIYVKNIGVSNWNKQEIIGYLITLLKFVFNDNNYVNFPRYAHCGLHICL